MEYEMIAPENAEGIGRSGREGNDGIFGIGIEILGAEMDRLGIFVSPPLGIPGISGTESDGMLGSEGISGNDILGIDGDGMDKDNETNAPLGKLGRLGNTGFGIEIEMLGNSGMVR